MKRYKLSNGYMNHKCPANVGKFKNIRDKSFKEVAPSICPQSKGKVLYKIMNTKKGGKTLRKRRR